MNVPWLQIVVIIVAGLVGGFVNTLAGGGSFLTLAALEFSGLPVAMANGTNRVAILAQNAAAVFGFKSKGMFDLKTSIQFAIPALLGSIVGAMVVIELDDKIFHRALALAMLVLLGTLLFDTNKYLKSRSFELTPARRWLVYPVFFLVGIYGGAIQGGVGFFMMAALVLVGGMDLVRTNSHKVLIVGLFTVTALGIFVLKGQVNWLLGIVLSLGHASGAWIASRLSVDKGERLVKGVLMVMLVVMIVQYLGLVPGLS